MAGKPRIDIDFDKIYESNSCGSFKIIENLGRDNRNRLYVRIKFLDSGTIKDVRYDIAIAGKIRDELYNIDFNKIYNSIYYGPFKIIKYIGRNYESKRLVRIKFINTGYENDVLLKLALTGQVRDYTIDYHDREISKDIDITLYDDYIINILENRWRSMISRCYNINDPKYSEYGAIGIQVADCWKIIDNYISDIVLVENFNKFYNNPQLYQLDKDYYQLNIPKSQRYYGPGRCIFLSIYDNANLAILEKYNRKSFFGIDIVEGDKYHVHFSIDGTIYSFGLYSDLKAAANAYNHYYIMYSKAEVIQLINNVDYMPFEETQKYLIQDKYKVKFNDYPLKGT